MGLGFSCCALLRLAVSRVLVAARQVITHLQAVHLAYAQPKKASSSQWDKRSKLLETHFKRSQPTPPAEEKNAAS